MQYMPLYPCQYPYAYPTCTIVSLHRPHPCSPPLHDPFIQGLEQQLQDANRLVQDLNYATGEHTRTVEKREEEILELQAVLERAEERGRQAALLQGRLGAVEAESQRLEAALQAAQADARQQEAARTSAQERAAHLEDEVERLRADMAQKEAAMQQAEAAAKAGAEQLRRALQQREEQVQELEEHMKMAGDAGSVYKGQVCCGARAALEGEEAWSSCVRSGGRWRSDRVGLRAVIVGCQCYWGGQLGREQLGCRPRGWGSPPPPPLPGRPGAGQRGAQAHSGPPGTRMAGWKCWTARTRKRSGACGG